MKYWNLSQFAALEDFVLLSYSNAERQGRPRVAPTQKVPRIKIALGIAALAANFSIGIVQANSAEASLPLSVIAVAQSIPERRPPLEEFFQSRYSSEWTQSLENELLMGVEQGRLEGSPRSLVEQTIDTVLSNQHENLSEERNRLTREQIAKLVRERKLT